jgi:UDPglucose--hexose-1-phosphate uridylyltransferase
MEPSTAGWVLVSPHRTQRPWQGQIEEVVQAQAVPYDPTCYLCPGNPRASGALMPNYTGTFVFDNDFAALKMDVEGFKTDVDDVGLLRSEGERGICRVLCFDPRHDLTLATMEVSAISRVVDTWIEQELALGAMPELRYVQIFENRGAMMGASNPHPHGQIWATESIPEEPALELTAQEIYLKEYGVPLLNA